MLLNEVFKPDGLLAQHFPDYEARDGQVRMAKLVESAIVSGYSAVIEAATGIGKSFAYLVPIILSGEKTIISTSNKSLQDQLSNKDLPTLKQILPVEFDWTVLKGRSNYFCHEHFNANQDEIYLLFKKENLSDVEARHKLKEIVDWANESETGDIEFYPNELSQSVKDMLVCDNRTVHEKGSAYYDLCFATRARLQARTSRLVLVNHTLLALDISLKKETDGKARLLPDTPIIILDEAHTFEKGAVLAFSDEISWYSLHHLLNWKIVKDSISSKLRDSISGEMNKAIDQFIPEKGNRGYYIQKRFDRFYGFDRVIVLLKQLIEKVKNNEALGNDDMVKSKISEVTKEAQNLIDRMEVMERGDDNVLRWSEAKDMTMGRTIVRLKSAPIDISSLLKEGLFKDRVVICTSATLAVAQSFDFFRYQIGVPETALELIIDTPFNFKENSLIYISTGEFDKYWVIQELLNYSKGRAFVLFTSYKEMEDIHARVDIPYPKLMQSNGISRAKLLEDFKATPNAVLFATKSFWEGIDVRGDQLLQVIVDKLPFENPSDLVYASKIERIDSHLGQGKSWSKYTVPDMCLKLKQGIGRLIRSKTDIGVISIMDARINYKGYGKTVIKSLPPAYRTQQLEKVKTFYKKWDR